ncbi:leucyl aminopeptidase [Candidatus Micrarchaeota archaeon]|nr:leucyl aminopeptidase [Candidatus Micrarchaeota archaeon]
MKIDYKNAVSGNLICILLAEGEPPPKELVLHDVKFEGNEGQSFSLSSGKKNILLVGLGKKMRGDDFRIAAGTCVRYAEKIKEKEISIYYPKADEKSAEAIAEGAILAGYKFDKYKTKKENFEVAKIHLVTTKNLTEALGKGGILASAQNYARALDEEPANIATPQMIANAALKLAKEKKLKVTVFDTKAMKKMGMNAILAVGQGSAVPPVLVKLEYNAGSRYPLFCVVGKGITFDSGGISIKPSKGMHEMKYDKTGAINVLGVFKAVAELKLPIRLMGLMPLAENTPGSKAQKPGDIIRAYNGKTIEVLNTDAEGRLVLADALAYAATQKPEYMIDMATLTGAMIVCLGRHAIGMFSDNDKLAQILIEAGEETHERVWRLPLWPEYGKMMESGIADLKNISELPEAGSITAAAFLKEFVGDTKWAHLDIAAVDAISTEHGYLGKGASGIGVRLVTEAFEKLAKSK